jgi:hypothetical protein
MRIQLFLWAIVVGLSLQSISSTKPTQPQKTANENPTKQTTCQARDHLSSEDFAEIMRIIQDGWNENDARKSANCFTEDAIYSSPPSRGHRGRENLYERFGGAKGSTVPMKIVWHHLVFDSAQQLGMAEYTFQYHLQTHGVVVLKLSHGLISNWREYDIASELSWDKFVGGNNF